jgi:N-glycosidase YbiA
MYPDSGENLNKETKEAIYFFTPAFYPLDNFSAHNVHIWGMIFPTVEHAFQWKKFSVSHPEIAKNILVAGSPEAVKKISSSNKDKVLEQWYNERAAVMEEILKVKAEQHEDVREILRKTGTKTIIENSPVDKFWGIGPDGKGENMVGKIWMKIRDSL